MPKFSKDSTTPNAQGHGTEWRGELQGYTTSMVSIGEDTDLTPLLQGLPGDRCPSPHWGYVFKGSLWFRHGEGHEEVINAGEAFYVSPGHTAGGKGGSEFVIFSPTEILAPVEAHMMRRAQELSAHAH
jgi:hypothetical protein